MSQHTQPPQPVYILRGHASQIHGVRFWRRNKRLVTGDAEGWIVVWDLISRRPVVVWRAHSSSILTVEVWGDDKIITHGRDEAVRVWSLPAASESTFSKTLPAEAESGDRSIPWLLHDLKVNTTNFCPISICLAPTSSLTGQAQDNGDDGLYLAAPASRLGYAQIFRLPNDAVFCEVPPSTVVKASMQMALKILLLECGSLCLITVTESGTAIVQALPSKGENRVWSTIYFDTVHTQPALGLDVAAGLGSFYTCGADSVIARHPLPKTVDDKADSDAALIVKTGHSGQQGLAIRGDERIFATAGWDSRVRIFSTKTLKELAVLKWHKEGCYTVAFGWIDNTRPEENEADAGHGSTPGDLDDGQLPSGSMVLRESSLTKPSPSFASVKQRREEKIISTHWVAAGSKDGKISLWELF